MRILVDSGDYRCSNMGDAAMLRMLVRRIEILAPGSSIEPSFAQAPSVNKPRTSIRLRTSPDPTWPSIRVLPGAPTQRASSVVNSNFAELPDDSDDTSQQHVQADDHVDMGSES